MNGKELRAARQLMGLALDQMAVAMGMPDKHAVSKLERGGGGRKPTRQHRAQVEALLFMHEHGLLEKFLENQQAKLPVKPVAEAADGGDGGAE